MIIKRRQLEFQNDCISAKISTLGAEHKSVKLGEKKRFYIKCWGIKS